MSSRAEMTSDESGSEQSPSRVWCPKSSTLTPDRTELGRYLEDTIVVDWQTPAVLERARDLVTGVEADADELKRVDVLFRFVRDQVGDALESEVESVACSASQVLHLGVGLAFSRCHLLAALLRSFGVPAGFGYQRLVRETGGTRLHGFVGAWLARREIWVDLDPCGVAPGALSSSSPSPPQVDAGLMNPAMEEAELTYPTVWARPVREVTDLLDQAPNLTAIRTRLPAGLRG
ncbi:transglutaminase family protein [Myxococcota bacterium]|nr:transglutaminase family protein [Myxococcota bacterium]